MAGRVQAPSGWQDEAIVVIDVFAEQVHAA